MKELQAKLTDLVRPMSAMGHTFDEGNLSYIYFFRDPGNEEDRWERLKKEYPDFCKAYASIKDAMYVALERSLEENGYYKHV